MKNRKGAILRIPRPISRGLSASLGAVPAVAEGADGLAAAARRLMLARMNRRQMSSRLALLPLPCLLAGAMSVCLAQPPKAGPQRNLWVELRWVDSGISAAAVAGVREGARELGTRRPSLARDTEAQRTEQQLQRVLVLNGEQASLQLSETLPLQWLELTAVAADAGPAGPGQPGRLGGKVRAESRSAWIEQTRGFTLRPFWPGGSQPVRVELQAQGPAAGEAPGLQPSGQPAARSEMLRSTVSLPLGSWLTVARSGARLQTQERGVLSSRDAEQLGQRELQLRVELAP